MSAANEDLLAGMLAMVVPIRMADLRAAGGPTEADIAWCRAFADVLGSEGDALLYRVKASVHALGTAEMFNRTARAIAILSFTPAGVRFAGNHWFGWPSDREGWDRLTRKERTA